MAFASEGEEIRIGAWLNILFGLSVLASIVVFQPLFDFSRATTWAYGNNNDMAHAVRSVSTIHTHSERFEPVGKSLAGS
jgi:hypothetical protein